MYLLFGDYHAPPILTFEVLIPVGIRQPPLLMYQYFLCNRIYRCGRLLVYKIPNCIQLLTDLLVSTI